MALPTPSLSIVAVVPSHHTGIQVGSRVSLFLGVPGPSMRVVDMSAAFREIVLSCLPSAVVNVLDLVGTFALGQGVQGSSGGLFWGGTIIATGKFGDHVNDPGDFGTWSWFVGVGSFWVGFNVL